TFLASSHLGIPLEEGKSRKPFQCRAEHPKGSRSAQVSNPGPGSPLVPVVTLHPPSREEFQGPYRNSTLLCQVRGPRRAPIQWLKNGNVLREGVSTEGAVAESSGTFLTSSRVIVTESDWDRGDTFTCQAEQETRNTSKGLECG
ncbi:IGHM protein, partial [Calyptomena viridis]|nr:IGHM protein [Calyptomena viridis]